mgnify:CR=1 FL=1
MAIQDEAPGKVAALCARFLEERKLSRIEVIDVAESLQIADCFVIASGRNPRHLRAAADELFGRFREWGLKRLGLEGYREAKWILIDLGDVIVHLFVDEVREFYDLDSLWGDCPRLDWKAEGSEACAARKV